MRGDRGFMGAVKLECHDCGSERCALLGGDDDSDWIVCQDCNANLITMGQLRDEIARQAREYATRSIYASLGRIPNHDHPRD